MGEFESQVTEQEIDEGTAGQESVVDSQEEDVTETNQDPGEGGNADPASQRQEGGQSHQDNAAARAARIRAEQETTERLQRQYDEQVAGMGIINPYTGKPFSSFKDFLAYGERFKADKLAEEAKRKGTTVEKLQEEQENQSWITQKRREEAVQKQAMAAINARNDFVRQDLDRFVKKYPDVDPGKLESNPKFRKFAKNRLYKESLCDLYEDFVELVSDAERSAVEKAARKSGRGTGGGQSGGGDGLTPAQRAELEEWNRDNPSMKMTAKEFLSM